MLWVNPYNRDLWDYNIRVAEEAAKLGFGEIQFDYIRFPEPYKSLPQQVFPGSNNEPKPAALAEYLKLAHTRLSKLGVRTTADIFGLVTTVPGALEVGQEWEKVAPVTDVLLPMVYPSHYPPGSFNIPRPNADPYKTIFMAISKAHDRNNKLGLTGERAERKGGHAHPDPAKDRRCGAVSWQSWVHVMGLYLKRKSPASPKAFVRNSPSTGFSSGHLSSAILFHHFTSRTDLRR
jgi:hypothetical protein